MAVHRRVVEERAETLAGNLRLAVDVDVPAKADDGLLRGAMAVVGVARAIEGDQALEVTLGPEDMAGKETVPLARRLFGDLWGADRAIPVDVFLPPEHG